MRNPFSFLRNRSNNEIQRTEDTPKGEEDLSRLFNTFVEEYSSQLGEPTMIPYIQNQQNDIENALSNPLEIPAFVKVYEKFIEKQEIKNLIESTKRISKESHLNNESYVFIFPYNAGKAYLFPNEFQIIFDFLDKFTKITKSNEQSFSDLVLSEKIKDVEYFWRIEQILKFFKIVSYFYPIRVTFIESKNRTS